MAVLAGAGFSCIPKLQAEKNESAANLHWPKDTTALHTNSLHMLIWYLHANVMLILHILPISNVVLQSGGIFFTWQKSMGCDNEKKTIRQL